MPSNLYAPPTAPVADVDETDGNAPGRKPRRPPLVWVIAAYYGLNVVGAAVGIYLLVTHPNQIPRALRALYQHRGWSQYVMTALVAMLKLAATICLIRMQRAAVWLLWLIFVYRICSFAEHLMQKDSVLYDSRFTSAGIAAVVGLLISLAIALYAMQLRHTKTLRT